ALASISPGAYTDARAGRPRRPLPRPGGARADGRLRGGSAVLRDRLACRAGGNAGPFARPCAVTARKGQRMSFTSTYLAEAAEILARLDTEQIDRMAELLAEVRQRGGRVFFLGVGGSAANASHAVNDFRKIAGIEAYAPTDNVSELTARTNDEGWASVFDGWLRVSRLGPADLVLVFSVGGGNAERNVSPNLVAALQ